MKKSEIAKGLDLKATSVFIATVIAFIVNSLLNNLTRAFEMTTVVENIVAAFVIIFSLFSYIMIVRGFIIVDKACRLSEKNENFYMGRNLTVFSVICIIFSVILSIAALVFSVFLAEYNAAEGLTASDVQARNNVLVIIALLNIAMQFFAISTPFIFYLWKIYKFTPKNNSTSNFALLTMIVMIVHLVIGILNSIYSVRGGENNFLPGFTSILNTVKFIMLFLFFVIRRNSLQTDNN